MGHLLGKRSVFCEQGVKYIRPEGGIRAGATLLMTLNDGLRMGCFLPEKREIWERAGFGLSLIYLCVTWNPSPFCRRQAQLKIGSLHTLVSLKPEQSESLLIFIWESYSHPKPGLEIQGSLFFCSLEVCLKGHGRNRGGPAQFASQNPPTLNNSNWLLK